MGGGKLAPIFCEFSEKFFLKIRASAKFFCAIIDMNFADLILRKNEENSFYGQNG